MCPGSKNLEMRRGRLIEREEEGDTQVVVSLAIFQQNEYIPRYIYTYSIPKVVAHRLEPALFCVSFATFSRSAFSLAMRELTLSSICPRKLEDGGVDDDDDEGFL